MKTCSECKCCGGKPSRIASRFSGASKRGAHETEEGAGQ